jgi:hypothetical protein
MTNLMIYLSTFLSTYDATELSSILIAGLPASNVLLSLPLTTKGPIELEQAKLEFMLIQAKHKSEVFNVNLNQFQFFINGLFQAEGTSGVYFPKKDSLRITFNFAIGQNYSPEAALLLLRLQRIIGVGSIKIEKGKKGIIHIKYVVTNAKDILEKMKPYFSLLYGQKKNSRLC